MIIPVRCFTCNNELANKYGLYKHLTKEGTNNNDIYNICDMFNKNTQENSYFKIKHEQVEDLKKRFIENHKLEQINIQKDTKIELKLRTDGYNDLGVEEKKAKEAKITEEFKNMLIFIILDFENYCCNRHFISHIDLYDEIS